MTPSEDGHTPTCNTPTGVGRTVDDGATRVSNGARRILSPSQLNALARSLLEDSFGLVEIEGEISNFARPASGHLYFSLKDRHAQVRCALFRPKSQWLRFKPADGMQVLGRGKLSLYEPRGDYQLILEHLEPAGEGALRLAFEALKAKLDAEGLFAAERKRPMPARIRHIGLLTSASGAAVHDVLTVLRRRFPLIEVDLIPVPVQGADAPSKIISMLRLADAGGRYDALLLTRGGGSLEDLAAFNDEALARCISSCQTFTVSAVGHEVDTSIADLVADLRCPTPTAAAEALTPDGTALMLHLRRVRGALTQACQRRLRDGAQRLDRLQQRLEAQRPLRRLQRQQSLLDREGARLRAACSALLRARSAHLTHLGKRLEVRHPRRQLDTLALRLSGIRQRLQGSVANLAKRRTLQLAQLGRTLEAVSPLATLHRGYAVLRRNGELVRSTRQVRGGDALQAQLADGELSLLAINPPDHDSTP